MPRHRPPRRAPRTAARRPAAAARSPGAAPPGGPRAQPDEARARPGPAPPEPHRPDRRPGPIPELAPPPAPPAPPAGPPLVRLVGDLFEQVLLDQLGHQLPHVAVDLRGGSHTRVATRTSMTSSTSPSSSISCQVCVAVGVSTTRRALGRCSSTARSPSSTCATYDGLRYTDITSHGSAPRRRQRRRGDGIALCHTSCTGQRRRGLNSWIFGTTCGCCAAGGCSSSCAPSRPGGGRPGHGQHHADLHRHRPRCSSPPRTTSPASPPPTPAASSASCW